MLPNNWICRPLHEVAEVRTGLAKGKTGLEDPIELPYLRVANVQDGHIDVTEVKTIAVERRHVERYTLKAGDILMTEGGDFDKLGRGAVWTAPIPNCLHQNHVFSVRVNSDLVVPQFLSALSGSEYGRGYFLSCAKRSTNLASINSSQLKAFPVLLPPLVEQRRIAQILSTWDQAIATAERLLANGEEQKLGLTQGLFAGWLRLAGHTSGWQEHLLGKLFTERVEPNREDLQLLSITKEQGVIPRDDVGRKDTSNEDKSKYLRICPGDIGYNTMRMWQGVSALSQYEGIISPAYTVITPGALIDGKFASYLFKSHPVVFLFYRHSQGLVSDTWNLKFSHFAKIKIKIPCIQEQRSIAEVLEKADQQIEVIQRQLSALREEKAALMSQILTGKRRVKLPDAETEAQA